MAEMGWKPFPFQSETWRRFRSGESGLIHAPTGTGKTLAAFLGPVSVALDGVRPDSDGLRVLWVTPLRALATDTVRSLEEATSGLGLKWTVQKRTSDTSSRIRKEQKAKLPHVLVTTPESLSIFLSRANARERFGKLDAVIVDEWHELMSSKRGVQTELALARLRTWNRGLRTWGMSATVGNLDHALRALVGVGHAKASIVHASKPKEIVIEAILPNEMDSFPWSGHLGISLVEPLLDVLDKSESALVFTNTRSQTEAWYREILSRRPEWAGLIALHHGSLDRKTRSWVESGIRDRQLNVVVCTSSLDLGVDFSPVDTVVQIGSPKGTARLLQRAGRSGHQPGATSRLYFLPTHAFELVEISAARRSAVRRSVESRVGLDKPLDVLVQHVVTVACGEPFEADELLRELRSTASYRDLSAQEWSWVLDFVSTGGPALRAYERYRRLELHDGRFYVTTDSVVRVHRQTIGTISGDPELEVRFRGGKKLGTVEERFLSRLRPGQTFSFAGRTLELIEMRGMAAIVKAAKPGKRGSIPQWAGGSMPLSSELAAEVRECLNDMSDGKFPDDELSAIRDIMELQSGLSAIPNKNELLIEVVQSSEGHHLFFFPFEGRNAHSGLASLWAFRMSRIQNITFTLSYNDYGIELLSGDEPPLKEALEQGLFSEVDLEDDIISSINAVEMSRRTFRQIARVTGLLHQGFPGSYRSGQSLQVSSDLIYDVLVDHDPDNLLLLQARREVLSKDLEIDRLRSALARLRSKPIRVMDVRRPTPWGFPLMVDRIRGTVSSEALADRVRKMHLEIEGTLYPARGDV